jgi:hypothetical protein
MFIPMLFGSDKIRGRRIAFEGLKTGKFESRISGGRYGKAEELPTKIHQNLRVFAKQSGSV